jgi:UDP-3-O-[3-hydroxymyristoyl] glucosamine N-acyltransferase
MIRELGQLRDIAEMTGGGVIGDPDLRVSSISTIDDAGADAMTFATDERYLQAALGSRSRRSSPFSKRHGYKVRTSTHLLRSRHPRRFMRTST